MWIPTFGHDFLFHYCAFILIDFDNLIDFDMEGAVDQPVQLEIPDKNLSLVQRLLEAKLRLAILKQEKKSLVEELHRQFLEGEVEPKRRLKGYLEKRKKMQNK
jgi:hypothetical protein